MMKKSEDMLNTVNRFLESNKLDWRHVHQVSVNGGPAMMGSQRSFRGFVKRENPNTEVDQCTIDQCFLGFEALPSLKAVFANVVNIINLIKTKDSNSHICKELSKKMGEVTKSFCTTQNCNDSCGEEW